MGGITTTIGKVKYIGIASLTIAILSILILNIISSYSSSKIESNAIDSNSELSTQANDSSSISLSFSNATGSCSDTSNPANVCMSIPDGGGIATGGHTVTVNAGSDIANYELKLSSKTEETALVNEDGGSNTATTTIEPITRTYTSIQDLDGFKNVLLSYASDNTWAYFVIGGGSGFGYVAPMTSASEPKTIIDSSTGSANNRDIYYGARVDNPTTMLAGDYTAQIVYTVTATLHEPTIVSISPTTYELGSNEGLDSSNRLPVTITGNYLSSTSRVYLTNSNTAASNAGIEYGCTNIQVASDGNNLTCTLPTDKTNSDLEAGTYNLTILADNGTAVLDNAFTYTKSSVCRNADPDSDCQIDIDDNMIPVTYVGYDGNGGGSWVVVSDTDIQDNPGSWYDYGDKQWANAVTVQNPSEYTNAATGTEVNNNDVLGYWVYIPRYAYEVQRRDAIDAPVSPQNFNIAFQTANQKNTPAATCSTTSSHKDYRTGCNINGTYIANSNNTTWATNPAFTWGDTELNGIWVGKYETTGKISAPTVKPNQHANISEYIGNFYLAAKSIGVNDPNNVGGGSSSTSTTGRPTLEDDLAPNSHHLDKATSHMLKNSEWGAITYLAHSKYGAGINTDILFDTNVQRNSAYPSSSADADGTSSRYSITGCGPAKANETSSRETYDDGAPLSADVIESSTACSTDPELGPKRAYNGELGVLSSTTNTIYGVYGLSGGAGEYVMGNRTTNAAQTTTTDTRHFGSPAKSPYVDLYVATPNGPFSTKPSWSSGSDERYHNYNVCTFETCGGTATYETTTVQSVSSSRQSWGGAYSYFVYSSYPWFGRGGNSYISYASPFYTSSYYGSIGAGTGSRAALLALPAQNSQ